MVKLGVNIDHVATVRQARKTTEPDPVWAAAMAELGGADQITVHLREDRRHIQDRDVELLLQTVNVKLNLECACIPDMLQLACRVNPDQVCLVPEKREEVTTEGGLNVVGNRQLVDESVKQLQQAGVLVSLFIDPDVAQIKAAMKTGAEAVELHTGSYANCRGEAQRLQVLKQIVEASRVALDCGLRLDAGHGLTYTNVLPIARVDGMSELNIGHSIVARAIFVGFQNAVREMKTLLASA